jgi:glycosyltransferase involved in cell wall biosynthesis
LIDLSNYLVENENYDVTFICGIDESLSQYTSEHIHYIPVKMKRGIAFDGLKVTWQLYKIFKREKFDIVQYSTRNASTYASIAAALAGIKTRIFCQWGMMFIAMHGLKRWLLKLDDKMVAGLATDVETESFSIRERAIQEGIYKPEKSVVIWNGSACGVNLDRYEMDKKTGWRHEYRQKYGMPEDATVFGYCGRITRDKGLNELFGAFREIVDVQNRDAYLMIVGTNDNAETIDKELLAWAKDCKNVIFTGYTKDVAQHYSALDVFASLSYREGFGLVVIEAAGMGVPGIVTDCPGQKDTIEDRITGISVPAYNIDKVVDAMNFCIENPEKVTEMGKNARKAVEEKYEQKELFHRLAEHRNQLIEKNAK